MQEQIIARKMLEHLTKENILPTPVTMSIWYLYFQGDNKPLVSRMKSLLSTGQPISEDAYNKLYESYVLKAHFKESLGINRTTTQIIDKANELKSRISEFVESVQNHQESLGGMRESLTIAETREAVEIILSEAIMQLKMVEADSVETGLWMEKGAKDIKQTQQQVVEIEQNMSRDFLTGLADLSYFQKSLQQMLSESLSGVVSKRYFVVFDIDNLDHYNEEFSWLVGDSIIRLVVKVIQEMTHENWQIMRLHEDEIAVIPSVGFPIHEIPEYIQGIRSQLNHKKLMVKQLNKEIKGIDLNAVIIKVAVYDDMNSLEAKIDKALKLVKLGEHGKIVKIDD